MASYLLGIDFGTGGCKACITDAELNALAYAFREYEILIERPGYSEHEPERYWEAACEVIRECIQKCGVSPAAIKCVAASSALPAMVMVDAAGKPIHRAYNLMDRRAKAEAEWVKEVIGEQTVFEITANRLEDHPTLINLLWEKNNRPETFRKIHKAHTIDSFVKYRLTGAHNVSSSQAAFYGVAYDVRKERFDEAILVRIGIDPALLPDITACDAIVGSVTTSAAAATGLAAGTPVASGQVDACAGWLGAGATEAGDIQMNLGTCGNFGVIVDNANFSNLMINFAYTVKGTYVVLPTTTTGGVLMRYIRDNFSPLEVSMEKLAGVDSYDLLNLEAEKIPPGSEGLLVLPYLMGERTPIWDTYAKGVLFGLSLHHHKGHMIRAMMESVGYALYDSFSEVRGKIDKLNVPIVLNEGGAKSKLWRKIITDIFDVPTVLVKNRLGAPYGDCLLAGKAAGIFKDYSIAKQKAEYVDLMEPDKKLHGMYMDYFALYKKLYKNVKENYVELYHITEKYHN